MNPSDGMELIAAVLVHFLWQGVVLASLLKLALHWTAGAAARVRYGICCAALLMMAVSVGVTAVTLQLRLPASPSGHPDSPHPRIPSLSDTTAATILSGRMETAMWSSAAPMIVVVTWAGGVCFFALRFMVGMHRTRLLRCSGVSPVPHRIFSLVENLRIRLGIPSVVDVVQSVRVEVPTVLGWLRPVILLPPAAITGLTPVQLEAVILHELAHVQRRDYLVNCLQRALECLLFYHPAVWWVSERVRVERENCCDDAVIQQGADRIGYARTLASLESLRDSMDVVALGVDGGVLLQRVRRVLGLPSGGEDSNWRRFLVLALIGAGVLIFGASGGFGALKSGLAYESSVRFLLRNRSNDTVLPGADYDAYRAMVFMERVLSPEVLLPVLTELERAGAQFGALRELLQQGKEHAMVKLRERIRVDSKERSGSTTVLKVRGSSPEEARFVAGLVARSLMRWAADWTPETPESIGTAKLRAEVREQEVLFGKARERLSELCRARGILEAELNQEGPGMEAIQACERQRNAIEVKLLSLGSALEHASASLKLHGELHVPQAQSDSILIKLQENFGELDRKLVGLRLNFSKEHPDVQAAESVQNKLKEQILQRKAAILDAMNAEFEQSKDEIKQLRQKIVSLRQDSFIWEKQKAEILEEKRRLESLEAALRSLRLKLVQEQIDSPAFTARPEFSLLEEPLPGRKVGWFSGLF